MSKKVYIYTLGEDGSEDVRYVGQTVSPGTRLVGHLNNDGLSESNPKHSWIEDVKSRDGKVAMTIVDECDLSEAVEREQRWIDFYNAQGAGLLNTAKAIRSIATVGADTQVTKTTCNFDGRVSSRDFQREIGKYIEVAASGMPLTVIRHSRPAAVLISHEMYTKLCERDTLMQRWGIDQDAGNSKGAKLDKIYDLLLWVAKKLGYSEARP